MGNAVEISQGKPKKEGKVTIGGEKQGGKIP